jgi:hypothetical protein
MFSSSNINNQSANAPIIAQQQYSSLNRISQQKSSGHSNYSPNNGALVQQKLLTSKNA